MTRRSNPRQRLRHHRQARPRRPAGAAAGDLPGSTQLRDTRRHRPVRRGADPGLLLQASNPLYDLSATPALSGQHGIRYDTVDLAHDLGLLLAGDLDPALAGDSVLRTAEDAYFTAAGEAFRAEAERIAADRAAQHLAMSSPRSEA